MIWLYFITGVRVSEGLGLIWENFSPTKSILHVEATLERDENGKFYRKIDSKKSNTTKSHNREIELDDETVRLLKNGVLYSCNILSKITFFRSLAIQWIKVHYQEL